MQVKQLDDKSLIRHFQCVVSLYICILTLPSGSPKYCVTYKNIQRYYTLKCLIRYMYLCILYCILYRTKQNKTKTNKNTKKNKNNNKKNNSLTTLEHDVQLPFFSDVDITKHGQNIICSKNHCCTPMRMNRLYLYFSFHNFMT